MKSSTLRNYIKLQKILKWIPVIKWVLGISFIVGYLDACFTSTMHPAIMGALILIWAPTITFTLLGAMLHFTADQEIHSMAVRYGLSQAEVISIAKELLSNN